MKLGQTAVETVDELVVETALEKNDRAQRARYEVAGKGGDGEAPWAHEMSLRWHAKLAELGIVRSSGYKHHPLVLSGD